ncbi:MAG: sterol desaturase family protein [Gemmatimonadaceae bacterium]|nr:sterol desaturase family protein [Gemmatimonadaceae bacterium]
MPFLPGFHTIHHSARSMDWPAASRLHFIEIIVLRATTSLPMFTLGIHPSVVQADIGFVHVWSSLLHANVGGDFDRLGHWLATPRFHHWHHGLEREAVARCVVAPDGHPAATIWRQERPMRPRLRQSRSGGSAPSPARPAVIARIEGRCRAH